MFDQFVLLKDLSSPILDEVLSQNDLYAKLAPLDISSLPKINLDNFINICNFVDYYQLIDDIEFIANIQYHILCKHKEVIDNIYWLPLNMRQKVYQNDCLEKMKCQKNNIKHIACYMFWSCCRDIYYDIDDASRDGYLEMVKYLFNAKHKDCTTANCTIEIFECLFGAQPRAQHRNCTIDAIDYASENGHLEVVKYLFEVAHKDCTEYAIDRASDNGHLEVVKYLFEVAHKDCTIFAIDRASENGHLEVVKYLFEFQHEDCTAHASYWAEINGHFEVVKYLTEKAKRHL